MIEKKDTVTFINQEGKGKRLMFVGNSVTRHEVNHDIGWHVDWGMAASSEDKDYVHLVTKEFIKAYPDAAICICQASVWELNYKQGEATLDYFEAARAFEADIIVMRIGANCKKENFDHEIFKAEYEKLISYLDGRKQANVILTTAFWPHVANTAIREYAKEKNYPLVVLEDLGLDDSMKAIGLFEHIGVAGHPGDKGMAAIAERLLPYLY